MAFALTNPLRRGGPLCPPAQVTVLDVGDSDWRMPGLCVGEGCCALPCVIFHGRVVNAPMSDFDDIGACAVDASRVCRGRRMEREIR